MMALLFDHIWQSSLFAGGAGLLTLALRRNSANARFWLWFAASVKFLTPFAALTAFSSTLAAHLLPAPVMAPPSASAIFLMQPGAQPFSGAVPILSAAAPGPDLSIFLMLLWAIGFGVVAGRWLSGWSQLRRVLRGAVNVEMPGPVAVKLTPSGFEPGLLGIWRPVILLPQGIQQRLSDDEVDAIMAHELCHFRRRDNLLAAIHMLVEALFWFYPLVWWIGARLNVERERACDESVLASGRMPQVYAESILKVCKLYLQSPLDCAAGVTGADLKNRMERIVKNASARRLNGIRKLLLGAAAVVALSIPVAVGLLGSPRALAQANTSDFSIRIVDERVPQDALQGPADDDRMQGDRPGDGALWLKREGQIEGDVLADARVRSEQGKPVIAFSLTPKGRDQFAEMTRDNLGRRLAIVVNNRVIDAPTVRMPILGGRGEITGGFTTQAQANTLVAEMTGTNDPVSHLPAPQMQSPEKTAELRAEQSAPRKAVSFDPARFDKYAGYYQLSPSEVFTVTRDDNHYLAGLTGQMKIEWFPESDSKFFATVVPAQISFTMDAQGHVTELVLHQNGMEQHSPRIEKSAAQAIEAAVAQRIRNNTPNPGTEAALRRYIAGLEKDQTDYSTLTPNLASVVRAQAPVVEQRIHNLGALKSITFQSVGPGGSDVYDVTFERGGTEWRIAPLSSDGKIGGLGFRPLP
jgi:beta-lactamase regulating signal transducer with metallopeptidase domain